MKQKTIFLLAAVLFLFAGRASAQSSVTVYKTFFNPPFEIKVVNQKSQEIGFFKYNPANGRLIMRGNVKAAIAWYVNMYLLPTWEVFEAQNKVIEQMNPDGSIKDLDAFKNALGEYRRAKEKHGL